MSGEQFSLVWNSFPTNLSSGLYTLLTDEHLVDVTLSAEGRILRAHKLILSVCSSYFRELFKGNTCKHPIVILKDVNYGDLAAMLHFMYQGEANIKQEDISSFLKLAETLQIKGLTKEKSGERVKTEPSDADYIGQNSSEVSRTRVDETPRSQQGADTLAVSADESFVRLTSSGELYGVETDSRTENSMRSISEMFNNARTNEDGLPIVEEEPLDYTSEMRETSMDAKESSNYGVVPSTNDPSLDYVPNSEELCYSQDYRKDTLGVDNEEPTNTKDHCDGTSYARGKRTVRGIPGSSLPLETTLRVVSELGPTLRVERGGKVVRMYSCPWCLRHFTRKENLKLHVRYIHGPLESLTCKLCGNKYKNGNSLRVHSYLYHNAKRNKHGKPSIVGGTA